MLRCWVTLNWACSIWKLSDAWYLLRWRIFSITYWKDVKFGFFPCFLSVFWCFVLGANPWHDIGKKHKWLTSYVSLEFFYFGTKFCNLLDFCTPFISDPHFWDSCFSFWVAMFGDKFSLRKKKTFYFWFFSSIWSLIFNLGLISRRLHILRSVKGNPYSIVSDG